MSDQQVLADTVRWLERAVIGLNLCPFAKGVHVKQQIHYAICREQGAQALLATLKGELLTLAQTDAQERDTTLMVIPGQFDDFLAFHALEQRAQQTLRKLGLDGELQIAYFHPHFQFAGTEPDDVTNYTNRSPYPTLHLIREASIDRAVQAFPQAEQIYERNMALLQKMGQSGWVALDVGPHIPNLPGEDERG